MKLNWHNLPDVINYAQKLGESLVILDSKNSRGNYNIIPNCRPDLILESSIKVVWQPKNAVDTYKAFDYSKTPKLLPLFQAGLEKLEANQ